MNLKLDFMNDSERRSSAQLSPRSILRVAVIIVPVVLAMVYLHYQNKSTAMDRLWSGKNDELQRLRNQLATLKSRNDSYGNDLTLCHTLIGWSEADYGWTHSLSNLMVNTPTNIQFRSLSIERARPFAIGNVPTRAYSMILHGVALHADADAAINRLDAMLSTGTYTQWVAAVTVEADFASEQSKVDRSFVLNLKTKPLYFYAVTE